MMNPPSRGGGLLPKLLIAVTVLFISILIVTWVLAKRANPIILDEKGNVRRGSIELVRAVWA